MQSQLHKHIMRRIWYAYGIQQAESVLATKAFWQGVVFGGALGIFAEVVHVASVFRNVLATPLGRVPEYVWTTILTAIKNGDLAKVVTLLLLVSIAISIARKVSPVVWFLRREQVG